jgi:membrane-bound lytic murein transglycosylase D
VILPFRIDWNINFTYQMMPRSQAFLIGSIVLLAFGAATGRTEEAKATQAPSAPDVSGLPSGTTAGADLILEKANGHLETGRQYYFKGDTARAKLEFDTAIEILLSAPENLPDRQRVERQLDQMCDLIYRFDVEKLGVGQRDEENGVDFDQAPIDEVSHMTFPVDETLAPKLKTELNQTASAIPLELSEPVLSYVHFFSTDHGRSILLAGFKRAGQYRPLIERIFAEENVPLELIYLAQAESGFLPRAVSRKNAVGMWQFVAGTGAKYDLVRTTSFDERLDPEKATRAAARYLKFLYARYGDWYLAMAAYNCGEGAIDRAVERTGYADYWELLKRHALPRETSNYVPIIVAMTIMAKNPTDYGLENIEVDKPQEFDSIQLTASTSLDLLADVTLQPVSVIRDLNPSLLRSVVPSGLRVHVPKGLAQTAVAGLEKVPAANRNAWRVHHVGSGDTLEAIARSYHLPAQRIVAVNHSAESLSAGDVLLIPAVYHEEKRPAKRASKTSRRVSAKSHGRISLRPTHVVTARRASPTIAYKRIAGGTAGLSD